MYSRDELEQAFQHYQEVSAAAAAKQQWRAWADLFTEDAVYIEHHYGEMHGREQIFDWIQSTMNEPLAHEMNEFPIEWYVIDEQRGWVICQVWNRMKDPGDGSLHQAYNFTLLKYAGNNQWSYEEDIYNPAKFETMIGEWAAINARFA
ncbi:MAG: hypothetical protein QOG53_3210 [Frankiales bacterium]|jgi:hypothetical protein|nr:hypothetical protein [Frankiales bacterium]